MNLDDYTVIVFCRNNLERAQEDIQTDHACFQLGVTVGAAFGAVPGITWLISKEKLTTKGLRKLIAYCKENFVMHYAMLDTDVDPLNHTAVAVMPANDEEKQFFRKYPLRNYSLGPAQAACGLTADEGAKADVAQLREHPVSNREVVGANPTVGSNSQKG